MFGKVGEKTRALPLFVKVVGLYPVNKLNELISVVFELTLDHMLQFGVFLRASEHILPKKEELVFEVFCQEDPVKCLAEDDDLHLVE